MVIGQFVDTYPPELDGVGQVTLSYCRVLTEMGHTCYYIAPDAPDDGHFYAFPVLLQKSVPFLKGKYRMAAPLLDWNYHMQIDRLRFDIVHAQSPFLAGEEALRIARRQEIPLVTTFHSKYYDDVLGITHMALAARSVTDLIVRFYGRCNAVWTVNNATAEVLTQYGYKGRITVMPNGTDPEPLSPEAVDRLRKMLPEAPGKASLLFVGQHNYKKNLHGVLQACALLKRQGVPFRLVTAGTGPDAAAIAQEAKSLGISEDCVFLGFISDRPLLMALYRQADLLVFPSIYDNAPMVLREAATMGTPGVLVKGSCAAEGVTDGDNGFICADESAEAIASAILRALPDAEAVGARARDTIPIRWSTIMRDVVSEYERLIRSGCYPGRGADRTD